MTELSGALLAKIDKLIDDIRNNQPQLGSDRLNVGDNDSITTGTQLTVTFTLNPQWITHLVEAYADKKIGCTYTWIINGASYNYNDVKFHKGKIVSGETVQTITLIVVNTSGSSVDIDYFIEGWGDRREGL